MQSSSDNGLSLERPQFEATGLVQGNEEIEVQHPWQLARHFLGNSGSLLFQKEVGVLPPNAGWTCPLRVMGIKRAHNVLFGGGSLCVLAISFQAKATIRWLITDCFTSAGRHWRVSSQTATAAIVTVIVTVTSCPFCLPPWTTRSNRCLDARRLLWEVKLLKGQLLGGAAALLSTPEHSDTGPAWQAYFVLIGASWKLSCLILATSNTAWAIQTVSSTPLRAQAGSCQVAAACWTSLAELLEGCRERSAASWRQRSRYKTLTAWARPLLDLLGLKPNARFNSFPAIFNELLKYQVYSVCRHCK